MAEVEIHTERDQMDDAFGRGVGIMVGIVGVLLSVVTILGHREHTAAILRRTEANDDWAYYQAKKIRQHDQEIAAALLASLSSGDSDKVTATEAKFTQESERYGREADDLQKQAEHSEAASTQSEKRALRFDLGEGFLELGMVMSSLYFLARRRFFVALGATGAVMGTVAGVFGLLA